MWGFGSRAWRGEPERLGSPCGQGEPQGGGSKNSASHAPRLTVRALCTEVRAPRLTVRALCTEVRAPCTAVHRCGWHGGRDARVPSVAHAGSASVSLAWRQRCAARQRREQARPQKTYPFKEPAGGGQL